MQKLVKNNGYVIDCEDDDNSWFSGFAECRFAEAGRQPDYYIDWSGKTMDGKECVMELKGRKYKHDDFEDAVIECYKLKELENQRDYHGKVAYYINHWNDGIISIHRIAVQDLREPQIEVMHAMNKGYGGRTESGKAHLDMRDAWLFNEDGKCVRPPIRYDE